MSQDSLKDLLPRFVLHLQDKKRSPSTILAYRADLDQLVIFLVDKNKPTADLVEPDDIETFRDQLLSQKYTPKSVSRKLNAVKTFFRFLMDEKLVSRDPYRALRDIVRSDTRITAIVEIILQTGLRISEVAGLKMENIKNGTLHVDAYATQSARDIPLNTPAKMTLEKLATLTQRGFLELDEKFATKDDLEKFVTKEELKKELKKFATKEELYFALDKTKDEIKQEIKEETRGSMNKFLTEADKISKKI
ncbi:MAG: Tyrosine recombinase XerC, partial [Candidatus Woesebacteria bacterium GW2011_GWA1_38_8]